MENENQATNEVNKEPMEGTEEAAAGTSDLEGGGSEAAAGASAEDAEEAPKKNQTAKEGWFSKIFTSHARQKLKQQLNKDKEP